MKVGKPRQMDHSLSSPGREAPISRLQNLPQNAFGALRLFFASSVIISHAAEIMDGSNKREPIFMIFGTTTAGALAVIGFFLISGYLITGSYIGSRSAISYLAKRVARIYPGFLVAFWFSILIVAPIGGAAISPDVVTICKRLFDSLALQLPWVPEAFQGTAVPPLNGSMWTISYEFRCYLIVMIMGMLGVLRSRKVVATLTLMGLGLTCVFMVSLMGAIPNPYGSNIAYYILGEPARDIRLITAFLAGALFYLYRNNIEFNIIGTIVAVFGLIISLYWERSAIAGSIVFGGYLVFATANNARWAFSVGSKNDISYGVYLYAWPITKILERWYPDMHPVVVALFTFIIVIPFGWASWLIVEKPVSEAVKRRLAQKPVPEAVA